MKIAIPKEFIGAIPKRKPRTHKWDYGYVFILAGSNGFTGAAYLTAQGAIRSGAGSVTLGVPKSLMPIMSVKLTEVIKKPFAETKDVTFSLKAEDDILKVLDESDAIAIGPGLSINPETQALVRSLIKKIRKPLVLDADGINAFKGRSGALNDKRGVLILTPHEGEMARIMGITRDAVCRDREGVAKKFVRSHNATLVLKGHETIVATPHGGFYKNKTGNPGMATAGAGDVLTGMITAFLGQGIEPFLAARLGVFLHGLAGDYAAKEVGEISLIASDILDNIPKAIKPMWRNGSAAVL